MLNNWLIRATMITPVMIALALIVKHNLIEPYSVSVLELNIEFEELQPMKKGDRENILDFEMKWQIIKGEWI